MHTLNISGEQEYQHPCLPTDHVDEIAAMDLLLRPPASPAMHLLPCQNNIRKTRRLMTSALDKTLS